MRQYCPSVGTAPPNASHIEVKPRLQLLRLGNAEGDVFLVVGARMDHKATDVLWSGTRASATTEHLPLAPVAIAARAGPQWGRRACPPYSSAIPDIHIDDTLHLAVTQLTQTSP